MPALRTPKPLRELYESRLLDALGRYRAAVATCAGRKLITQLAIEVEAAAMQRCSPPLWHKSAALSAIQEGLTLARLDGVKLGSEAKADVNDSISQMLKELRDRSDEGEEWKRGRAS